MSPGYTQPSRVSVTEKKADMGWVRNGGIVAVVGVLIGMVSSLGIFNWLTIIGIGIIIYGFVKGSRA